MRILATLPTLVLSIFALLVIAPIASAAPKTVIDTIGSPQFGTAGGLFFSPLHVAVNQTGVGGVPAGTFYIVDGDEGRRIQRFSPTRVFVSAWGWGVGAGNEEYEICSKAQECRFGRQISDPLTLGAAGSIENPQAIAVDQSKGKVYVSDPELARTQRINVFSAKGAFEGAFGWGVINKSQTLQFCTFETGCKDPSTANTGQGGAFPGRIGGLAVDAAGNVYVANGGNRRVDVFKPILTGGTVTGVEFVRAFGWDVVITGKPNNISTAAFEVCDTTKGNVPADCKQAGTQGTNPGRFANNSPADVAVDSEGNVFALDAGNNRRIQEFSSVPAVITATFGKVDLETVFGAGASLLNIAVDPSAVPNHLLVSGVRTAGEKVAIAELDGLGNNAFGAGKAHGEELTIATAGGLAAAKASIGGNLYLATESVGVLRGAYVLNEAPTIEPVTTFTGTTALFEGEVVSNELEVEYHFEYSTDKKKWTSLPTEVILAGAVPGKGAVEQEAVDLTGSQEYFVRLVQNRPLGGGKATSTETTFTTKAEKPAIQGSVASPVKDTSATFNAYLDPQNQTTTYRFEYGLADCSLNPCIALSLAEASGGGPRLVTQTATDLEPATLYHFRLIATNPSGETKGPDRSFETFASDAQLPDDRAYELVTPPDTAAVVLTGGSFGTDGINCFDTFPASADGDSVVSTSGGGSLPGLSVNGRWDLYESIRGPAGWSTVANSASLAQTTNASTGLCVSPDHLYSTLGTGFAPSDQGSLVVEGKQSNYIRVPGGVANPACSPEPAGLFELIGCGSLSVGPCTQGSCPGADPEANARWITSGATHIVFVSEVHLEPNAPPTNTKAVYDRSPGGPTQVVSLLPGNVALSAGENAAYQGTSTDGSTVAFKVGGTMYARVDNAETLEVAAAPNTFAGVSRDGESVFYANAALNLADPAPAGLFVFDTATKAATEIAPNSIFVNVSEDGSHVYFTSQSALAGAAKAGKDNLYVWDRVSKDIEFIAVLDLEDLKPIEGVSLKQWMNAVKPDQNGLNGRANDPSRTTPDGSVLLFESRANLIGYDSGGHVEIYRYDVGDGGLDCVSCPPTGVPAASNAALQPSVNLSPTNSLVHIQNVTDDGQKVFFQTQDALVPGDINATWDVYEWKVGQQPYPISSGHGQLPSFLYAMTPSGSDVFFTTTERLVPQDLSTISSIYDAREGGGFPVAEPQPDCLPDGNCQGTPSSPPQLPGAGSASQGPGNEPRKPRCSKNQRRVKRNGKIRCVKKHHHKAPQRQHRANPNRRAAR